LYRNDDLLDIILFNKLFINVFRVIDLDPVELLANLQTASVKMVMYVAPSPPDVILHGGEAISTGLFNFQVLWAPGHSPGHICLYEPEKNILLSPSLITAVLGPQASPALV